MHSPSHYTHMPVVALTEKGLIVDVFGQKPVIMKSQEYRTSNNKLVSIYNKNIRFMDLHNPKDFTDLAIDGYVDMAISKDGTKVVLLGYDRQITVFDDRKEVARFASVDEFDVSDSFFGYSIGETFYLHSFHGCAVVFQGKVDVKKIHCLNTFALVVTRKAANQRIIMIRDGKSALVLELPDVYQTVLEASDDEKRCLILVDVEYSKNSYYADSELYYLMMKDGCSVPEDAAAAETDKKEKVDPTPITKNSLFELFLYKTLKKVSSFKFLDDKFYVCFGNQPACLHMYSSSGQFLKNFRKTIRNKVCFSRDQSKIINAGLGNLPGNFEVFSKGVTTCKFESLGASIVEWLNDDTHFMVATTNYFKSDNKVKIYDYYGRAIEEMECDNLVRADVYGDQEPQRTLEAPAQKIIPKANEAYVPPHLQTGCRKAPAAGKIKTEAEKENSPPKRTKAAVEQELEEARRLKERLGSGEDLTLEEQNKVFSIGRLTEEWNAFN